ncbi:MAG: cysteine--tRNA ligase [Fimbriimonadaceae bacterium]|nr:cysteine--tRNA ligase [Fimbriimonadaceae bacterium]
MVERSFKLYDSLSRTIKPLETIEPGHLRFYSCGPTVYSYAHIGNFRTFLSADLVCRTAKALGWKVTYVSNITDVGHLTQDDQADAAGEDKMAAALKSKEGESFANVWDLARYYGQKFEEDWRTLNLQEPTVRPRATEHMREQIIAVQNLIEQGHAYETPSGVYFNVESFPDYGKLSGNRDRQNLQNAVRDVVQDENKRQQADFALWKKDEKHLMQWFSPWGWGFPGWHIECSVMARMYLGDTIDLHGGGEDLKFPHHECEIAQSECATHKPFANHWMHVTFLQVEGEKMSKSLGNFFTVRDLVNEGHDPLALRYALISVPYGRPLNFTMQTLKDAAGNVGRFREVERRIEAVLGELPTDAPLPEGHSLERVYHEALDAMCEDLNTSVAIAKALEGMKILLRQADLTRDDAVAGAWFLKAINDLLGIVRSDYAGISSEEDGSPLQVEGKTIEEWIEARASAKKNRDFAEADRIRDLLNEKGIELRDTPQGVTWIKR